MLIVFMSSITSNDDAYVKVMASPLPEMEVAKPLRMGQNLLCDEANIATAKGSPAGVQSWNNLSQPEAASACKTD